MKEPENRVLKIGAYATRICKSNRDRFSGVLRYFRDHPEPKAIIVNLITNRHSLPVGKSKLCHSLDGVINFTPDQSLSFFGDAPVVSESTKNGIMLDNAEVGATAARLFLRRGYCNFAYIGNNAEQESFHSGIRREAFARTAAADGFECASHSFNGKYSSRELSRLSKFLMAQPKPCAVLAYSDNIAKFVYDACNLANLSIPDQIGVIGVDNETSICETLRPPLTSILPDFEACGYIAAEALMRKILAPGSPPDLGNSLYGVRTVFERESSMDIDGSARLVSRAREYIATHYPEPLAVKAIARHLGTCRRRLELKFRKVTGGTVHDEIKRVRLDCAKRLLSNTNLTVGEISAAAGYGTEAAFRAAFAKAERMSPRQFRCRRRP